MKLRTFSGVLVAVLAMLTAFASTGATLPFSNGDFETGSLAPWFQDREFSIGKDWSISTLDPHSGNFAATNTGNKEIRQDFDGIPVESILEISFWAKRFGQGPLIFVDLFYSDTSDNGFVLSTTQNWEFFDVTSRLAAGKTLVGFSVFGNSTGCALKEALCTRTFLDDVQIVVPESTTGVLLGLGVVAIAGNIRSWLARLQERPALHRALS